MICVLSYSHSDKEDRENYGCVGPENSNHRDDGKDSRLTFFSMDSST